ncbi:MULTISPECIES: methionine--tRNA ligase [unclassified Wolbachia]|uniref:methionine--tRNA ligase n=1 Tax=unclassified Wolbachia TaxID=2640676 RepID=UPI0022205E0D|nr:MULTISPECIES: methionine--tRNA ligase [unclassified Wolbachia]MDX5496991.1 methionine--tRNA ligase [Wolbachia endosymbiont of Nomada fabriciana]MDX5508125.1 methionine--tRNA ligase [Wolbachia endosymbiont of Hylaeus sinuatus]MDX5527615.1 methionine--tRNA ligase [Wolbachia endosymbiont of Andrena minutula]
MEQFENFYITTPVYYVNDKPHIGHAYTSLLCDVVARFMKLAGKNVKFTTGTDEHGQKIEKAAKAKEMQPKEFTDEVSVSFKELAKFMNFEYDDFIRTTEERHKKAVIALWNRLEERGQIYLDSYSGWYSVRDEAFYQESELIDGKAPTGAEVQWIKEESYFFRLSNWQEKLLELYKNQPSFIFPESRRNEVISFVRSGLIDLSISRTSFNWGIKVPGNDKHVIYVWIDALTNYLTSIGFPSTEGEEYKRFWAEPETQIPVSSTGMTPNQGKTQIPVSSAANLADNSFNVHVIGKDILRFHAVYWPAILLAADLPLPKQIAVHGWWLNEGEKISKSLGNVIDPIGLAQEFGVDQLRYFLLREASFGQDGNFSKKNMISRINSELANNIGNLVQRTISFLHKQCSGIVPTIDQSLLKGEESLPGCKAILDQVMNHLSKYEFNHIILLIINISSEANAYIDKSAPWTLSKTDRERMNLVIYKLLEYIRIIGILLQPIVPRSAEMILDQLQIPKEQQDLKSLCNACVSLGITLPKPTPVFLRVDAKEEK